MKLFDYDSSFMRFVVLLSRLTVLNLLWILCCIPVVTAGASTAALHSSAFLLMNGDMHVFGNFKSGFKNYRKQGTVVWIFQLLLGFFFLAGYYVLIKVETPVAPILSGISALMFLTMVLISLWVYPIMVEYTGTLKEISFHSSVFAFLYAPYTLLAAALYIAIGYVFLRFMIVRPLVILFAPALAVYGTLVIFDKVFAKYRHEQ